jgi:hypothetical protein
MEGRRMRLGNSLDRLIVFMTVLCLSIWLLAAPQMAQTYPDTGQTKCYNATQEIPCPQQGQPFYGQDGNYQWFQLAYRDNGNGTVIDLNTGLIWQQGDAQNDAGGRTWQEAVDYCASLDLGNHADWRLPTKKELASLVDYAIPHPGPTIDTTYFPECRTSTYYWSSSSFACYQGAAWGVHFYEGYVFFYNKNTNLYVRCVRREQ